VRVPVIRDHNDNELAALELGYFLLSLENVPAVEMLPYHRLGEGKYESLGLRNGVRLEPPARSAVEALAALVRDLGLQCEVGG